MNTVVIDGYNLIRRVPELYEIETAQGLESCRRELERVLAAYIAGRKGLRAVVVYDSASPVNISPEGSSYPGLTVRFVEDADRLVVELSRRFAGQGDHVRVVSSDRAGVGGPLSGVRRTEVISAEDFWRNFLAGRIGGKSAKGDSKRLGVERESANNEKPPRQSPEEKAYWLEAFGVKDREEKSESPEKPRGLDRKSASAISQGESEQGTAQRMKDRRKKRYLRRLERGK
ncbi:MAG TPA: NYN domain-containing protein [archaeon]|nr:NYN domain-containing protein [archaeon]